MPMVQGDCSPSCLGCLQSSILSVCIGSQCVCTCVSLNMEAHCVTSEWGVAGKWDAEALRAFLGDS